MAQPVDPPAPQGGGTPGANPLFFGVLLGLLLGLAGGLSAGEGEPATALHSNLVFRIEVGLVAAFASYWAAAALWLAWHRTLFQRLGLGNAGVESPKQKALEERDTELEDFMGTTTDTIKNLTERIEALEDRAGSRP